MRKNKLLLVAALILAVATALASCNSGVDKGTTVDTTADTLHDVQPLFDESIEYDENDEVVAAFAKSSDKSVASLLAALGDNYTLDSEHLINWHYDLRCGYASYENYKVVIDSAAAHRFKWNDYIDAMIYRETSPCTVTLINVNGTPYTIYSTVKTSDDFGLFGEHHDDLNVDASTLNTVFRIVKDCGESVFAVPFPILTYEETGSAVYHDTDFDPGYIKTFKLPMDTFYWLYEYNR